jgi:hypothetical protein
MVELEERDRSELKLMASTVLAGAGAVQELVPVVLEGPVVQVASGERVREALHREQLQTVLELAVSRVSSRSRSPIRGTR